MKIISPPSSHADLRASRDAVLDHPAACGAARLQEEGCVRFRVRRVRGRLLSPLVLFVY